MGTLARVDLNGRAITVFCGSSDAALPRHFEAARALGRGIARAGATVVYGGASVGLMGAIADAALAEGGAVVGVIPRRLVDRELAHARLTELVVVETMHERKAIMSARADAYVALPGGFGTYEELLEVVTWKQLSIHDRPVVAIDLDGYYAPLRAQIERAVTDGLMRPALRDLLAFAPDVAAVLALLEAAPVPTVPRGTWF